MQVYLSALVFCPTNSIIRGLFRTEQPSWPVKPRVDDNWSPSLQTLEGHDDNVISVTFSPDERILASSSEDSTVKLWDTTTGQCVRTIQTSGPADSVAFSTNGVTLASASNCFIELWNTRTGHCVERLATYGDPQSVAFSSDEVTLASGSDMKVVQLWDLDSSQCVQTLKGHHACLTSVIFSRDGSLITSASDDNTVKLWETNTGICLKTVCHYSVISVGFPPGGPYVAFATDAGVEMQNLTTCQHFRLTADQLLEEIDTIGISCDGTKFAAGLESGGIYVWDVTTNQSKRMPSGHHGRMMSIAFAGGGALFASASTDESIKLWDLTINQPHAPLQLPFASSASIRFRADNCRALSMS
ncbi:Vegetative incompatibility protein HET-E-1 [Colletotrichum fructicola]|nr:Vegetative incompatibility protein HET-E-1 [Colletotrichum fructicola]KAF4936097.1 Vegetative incompatibility protein HET-E-1 [Colletotrichum fructicola]